MGTSASNFANLNGITIQRPARRRRFVVIDAALAQDARLSFEARGMLLYLLSKPDDWEIRVDDLRREGQIGRDKARRILDELLHYGYLVVAPMQRDDQGQFAGTRYLVIECPAEAKPADGFTGDGKPVDGLSDAGKPAPIHNKEKNKRQNKQKTEPHKQQNHTGDTGPLPALLDEPDDLLDREQAKEPDVVVVQDELIQSGVHPVKAKELVQQYSIDRVREVLQEARRQKPDKPAGWITSALAQGWRFEPAAALVMAPDSMASVFAEIIQS